MLALIAALVLAGLVLLALLLLRKAVMGGLTPGHSDVGAPQ
jgi:hypothetical protein